MKPSLDLIIFNVQLARSLGGTGSALLCLNYFATVAILRAVTPAFGRLAAVEARLEGEYRAGVARVERESEEIAYVHRRQNKNAEVLMTPTDSMEVVDGRGPFCMLRTFDLSNISIRFTRYIDSS